MIYNLDNDGASKQPDTDPSEGEWLEQAWKSEPKEESLFGDIPQKLPQFNDIIEQLERLAKKTDGVASVAIYPDGSGTIKVEYPFNNTGDVLDILIRVNKK